MEAPQDAPGNIESKDSIPRRAAKGIAERLVRYVLTTAGSVTFLVVVLWGISYIPEPEIGSGGVGAAILRELEAGRKPAGISFPAALGEMRRGQVTDYEKEYEGLGLGVQYIGPSESWADIYVYNLGLTRIPGDLQSEQVTVQFAQAQGDIVGAEKAGSYHLLRNLSQGIDSLGKAPSSPQVHAAHFSYTHSHYRIPVLSHLYLGVYKDHFIKIRFSYPREQEPEGKKLLSRFLDELGNLLTDAAVH